MQSDDYDSIKRYCTHLVRHQMHQDVFLASLLGRLVELEAFSVIHDVRKEKNIFKKIKKRFFK